MNRRPTALVLLLLIPSIACFALTGAPQNDTNDSDAPQATEPPATEPPATQPQQATEPPNVQAACSVVRNLKFRSGPGEAYPAFDALTPNTTLTPLGISEDGFWAYVQNVSNQDLGWVGASDKNISCNVDLFTLPVQVADAPPPQTSFLPKSVLGAPSEGGGTCGAGLPYDCYVNLSDDFFAQYVLLQGGVEQTQDTGVLSVDFFVFSYDKTETLYSHTESQAPYCIFGGDGSCAAWAVEDGVYKWGYGGRKVESGTYVIGITPNVASGEPIHWEYFVDVTAP